LHTKPNNLPWIDPKPRKTFNEDDIEWNEEEDSRSAISRMANHEISRNFKYKGGKKETIPLYSRNYVNEKGGHKNRKLV